MTETAELPLSNGGVTLVDADLVHRLSRFTWFSHNSGDGFVYVKARTRRVLGDGPKKHTPLHRFIMAAPAGYVVDHINGDTLDNRRCNLQIITQSRNCMKNRKAMAGTVYYDKTRNRWRAWIRIDGKRHYLGVSKDKAIAEEMLRRKREEAWSVLNPMAVDPGNAP
jgi:hypothetical protein